MSDVGDIQISVNSLSDLITVLKADNAEICNIIKNTKNAVNTLSEKKWSTPEKDKMDSMLLPYFEQLDTKMESYLNECTTLLENAAILYSKNDESLAIAAEDLAA